MPPVADTVGRTVGGYYVDDIVQDASEDCHHDVSPDCCAIGSSANGGATRR